MMTFKDLLDFCQVEAIANKLSATEESSYRAICRSYSKTFHTPLHLVQEMDPEHVVLSVYEEQLETMDDTKFQNLENMLEIVLSIENPEYEKEKNTKLDQDIAKYEREEEERIKAGRAIHPALKNKFKPKEEPKEDSEEPAKPVGGSANLGSLSEENES